MPVRHTIPLGIVIFLVSTWKTCTGYSDHTYRLVVRYAVADIELANFRRQTLSHRRLRDSNSRQILAKNNVQMTTCIEQ